LSVLLPATAIATATVQHYNTGTSCDDAWQEGPFPGTTSGINPLTTYKQTDSVVGWDGQGHIFNPGFRFENVQFQPHQTVPTTTFSAEFINDFSFVTSLDIPVEVEINNAADICYTNDIIYHRTFTASIHWHATVNPNGGVYTSIDITALVQQAVNSPAWHLGASLLVRLVGEDGRTEYPYSYGWNVVNWDAHDTFPPSLDVFG
jgi:hypothetical protein